MRRVIYHNLDRFIEDTESYRKFRALNFKWPFHGAIILYRYPYRGLAIYQSKSDIVQSYRLYWVELEIVKGGHEIQPLPTSSKKAKKLGG